MILADTKKLWISVDTQDQLNRLTGLRLDGIYGFDDQVPSIEGKRGYHH